MFIDIRVIWAIIYFSCIGRCVIGQFSKFGDKKKCFSSMLRRFLILHTKT